MDQLQAVKNGKFRVDINSKTKKKDNRGNDRSYSDFSNYEGWEPCTDGKRNTKKWYTTKDFTRWKSPDGDELAVLCDFCVFAAYQPDIKEPRVYDGKDMPNLGRHVTKCDYHVMFGALSKQVGAPSIISTPYLARQSSGKLRFWYRGVCNCFYSLSDPNFAFRAPN